MGQHADDIINGDVDEISGEWLGNGQGYPRTFHSKKQKENLSIPVLTIVQKKLTDNGYTIIKMKEIDFGYQLRTLSGSIVNIYSSGKIVVQGKLDETLKNLFK